MRLAGGGDEPIVARLAALAGRPATADAYLLAEVDGEARAALAPSSGEALADPFSPTAEVLALLALRAEQLRRHAEISGTPKPTPTPRRAARGGVKPPARAAATPP